MDQIYFPVNRAIKGGGAKPSHAAPRRLKGKVTNPKNGS